MDHVDGILAQWARERPDLDVSAMGVIGRVGRLYFQYLKPMEQTFQRFGLNAAKFDVLATLRRSGPPYELSVGALMAATMVASGTMTNRLDRLASDELIRRRSDPEDSRSFLISLTDQGLALIDEVVTAHVQTQADLVAGLTQSEQAELAQLLAKALQASSRGKGGSCGGT